MDFDIPNLHIPDDSAAARVIEAIVAQENVTPAEAVQRALQRLGEAEVPIGLLRRKGSRLPTGKGNPEDIIGMFADSPELGPAIDAVIASRSKRYGEA